MVIIPETQDRKGHWGHRPSRLFPAVRGGAAGRPVAMARPGWRARCPDLQAQDARLGRGSGSVLSEVPCSVWAARGVWVLSVGPRVRQGRHNRPPFPRARGRRGGRGVALGDRAAQAPPRFQGFRVPASNRPHACRPPGAMAGGAPWGSPRSAVTLQPRAAGAAASTPRTRKLRLELRACSDRTRATRRRGAGLACGRRPPPRSTALTGCVPGPRRPCARGGGRPRCSLPRLCPQHRRGKGTHALLIKCPLSRHPIGPVGPRQRPFSGASPRRLNYARGLATRGADGGTCRNQSPWQVRGPRRHMPGALLPLSPGAEDTHSPSWPGSHGEGRSLLSPGLGRSLFDFLLMLPVSTLCGFWGAPHSHGAQMGKRAPKRADPGPRRGKAVGGRACWRGPQSPGRGVS